MIRVACVQFDIAWEEPQANINRVDSLLGDIDDVGLIVLPELWPVGFSMRDHSRRASELAIAAMKGWAAAKHAYVLGGVPVPDLPRQRNCAMLIAPDGREVVRYYKRKLFAFAGENAHYLAGTESVVASVGLLPVAPLICYDLRFPELARALIPRAKVIIYIASWPHTRRLHWRQLLIARAIENQAYVVGVNRIGRDGNGLAYVGDTMIVDPMGQTLADAGDSAAVLVADIDYRVADEVRERLPFLQDMDLD